MEWNKETEIFILIIYILIPTLAVGAAITGLILLLRNLVKSRNKGREEK